MGAARKPRVVRATELSRVLDVLAQHGLAPAATDLLPGGVIRLHQSTPANDTSSELEAEARAWDEALGA